MSAFTAPRVPGMNEPTRQRLPVPFRPCETTPEHARLSGSGRGKNRAPNRGAHSLAGWVPEGKHPEAIPFYQTDREGNLEDTKGGLHALLMDAYKRETPLIIILVPCLFFGKDWVIRCGTELRINQMAIPGHGEREGHVRGEESVIGATTPAGPEAHRGCTGRLVGGPLLPVNVLHDP